MDLAIVRAHLTAALFELATEPLPAPALPAPPPAPAPAGRICVDAGHGGHDPGAVAGTAREKDLTLIYALALRDELKRRGHAVTTTRNADEAVALSARVSMANAGVADCFVSIHANSADSVLANGAWVIHDDSAGADGGKALAGYVFDRLATMHGVVDGDPAREVFPDGSPQVGGRQLAVLSQTRMPAILVELGFMTNEEDMAALKDPSVRATVVGAIADGVEDWLRGRAA